MSRLTKQGALAAALAAGAWTTIAGCDDTAPPRRQILLFVDTDAPTVDQARVDETVSQDAVVDTVRVDVLDREDRPMMIRELTATDTLDWPLSFGIVPPASNDSPTVRLRIRAFRASDALSSVEIGTTTLEPPAEIAIDRVIEIPYPQADVVDQRSVTLLADCIGRPPSFRTRTTCVDANRTSVLFTDGIDTASGAPPSRVGSWSFARATPCAREGDAERACVPGGLSTLGSRSTSGLADGRLLLSSLPLRQTAVEPFLMDRHEFTVGRARPLLARLTGDAPGRKNDPAIQFSAYCTLSDDPSADGLPLNCVSMATAQELCTLAGGDLPTEAEWNHAATGRGQRRRFPWGAELTGCCNASLSRVDKLYPEASLCVGDGPEPPGAHPGSADCAGDVSRDGVMDLGGGVAELVIDAARSLDDPCWGDRFALLHQARCVVPGAYEAASRGGNWSAGTLTATSSLRHAGTRGPATGFRCVYRGAQ